jgi:hypothetical protein
MPGPELKQEGTPKKYLTLKHPAPEEKKREDDNEADEQNGSPTV